MTEVLQFGKIHLTGKAQGVDGVFKMNKDGLGWRSSGGQSVTVVGADLVGAVWTRAGHIFQLKLLIKGGATYKFDGFSEKDFATLSAALKGHHAIDLKTQEISTKGWNWGSAVVEGASVEFLVEGKKAFDLPLKDVASASANKQEVVLEFHSDDTAGDADSLHELRFHIPNVKKTTADGEEEEEEETEAKSTAESFAEMISARADLAASTGKAVITLPEMPIIVPRGRYTVEMFPTFLKLHGKSYNFKVSYSSIVRLFHLPKPGQKVMFFVVSLEPAIRRGNTSYPHIIFQLNEEDQIQADVVLTDELKKDERFAKLGSELSGAVPEVIARVFKTLTQKVVTIPKGFKSHFSNHAIRCSLKTVDGYLYPLEKSFFFVQRPTHIRYEDIVEIEFPRYEADNAPQRTFDMVLRMRSGSEHVFTAITSVEYTNLTAFLDSKGIKMIRDATPRTSVVADVARQAGEEEDLDEPMELDGEDDEDLERLVAAEKAKKASKSKEKAEPKASGEEKEDQEGSGDESDDDRHAAPVQSRARSSRNAARKAQELTRAEMTATIGTKDDEDSDAEFDKAKSEESEEVSLDSADEDDVKPKAKASKKKKRSDEEDDDEETKPKKAKKAKKSRPDDHE